MKFDRIGIASVLGLFIFFISFVSVSASETEIQSLQLEKGSINPFEEVVIDKSGEEGRVVIKGSKKANGLTEAYHVEVNEKTGTYTVEPKEVEKSSPITNATTTYSGWVRAITDDPPGVDLTKTTLNFSWYDYGSTVNHRSSSLGRWAANPSSLGTNWYKSDWFLDDPYLYYSNQKLQIDGSADYYNYNFLDNDKITEVDHFIIVDIKNNGTYDYTVDWGRRGEGSLLLDLDIEVN